MQALGAAGASNLARSLAGAWTATDEIRLFVYPTVQGRGRRMFPDDYRVERLDLLDSVPFASGITLQRYRITN